MKSLTIDGTELWCVDRGDGRPLLLVHGFPLDHTMWTDQIDELSTQYRVIAPDLRGFGRSNGALSPSDDKVTMDRFADDLAALLDGLGVREPVVFCGLSMGGYIAFQFWRRHASRLAGLILCDTRAAADSPEAADARRVMAQRVLREGPSPLVETMLPRLLAEATWQRRPDVAERLRNLMMSADPHGIAAATRGMAERPDMTSELGRIRCPTLALVGQSDTTTPPAEMRTIAEAIPDAQFVEIPEAGHLSPMENPAAVSAAIAAFLKRV